LVILAAAVSMEASSTESENAVLTVNEHREETATDLVIPTFCPVDKQQYKALTESGMGSGMVRNCAEVSDYDAEFSPVNESWCKTAVAAIDAAIET